jgi:hypothetical protein
LQGLQGLQGGGILEHFHSLFVGEDWEGVVRLEAEVLLRVVGAY